MEVCIKDKSWFQKMDKVMEKLDKATVYKNGLTGQFTKVNGTKTKLKEKAHSGMPKETFTSAIFEPTRQMDSEYTLTLTAVATKVNGLMMFKKVKEKKFG
jgi:Tfp pilus assembly major pilin PilA